MFLRQNFSSAIFIDVFLVKIKFKYRRVCENKFTAQFY